MTALPPLDSVKECPACERRTAYDAGLGQASAMRFCLKTGCGPNAADGRLALGNPQPHMHRTCPRCGYEWLEATLLGAEPKS